jgi:hypothetical protein
VTARAPYVLDLREPARAARIEVGEPGGLRMAAIGTWRGRMVNEYESAQVFDALAPQLEPFGAQWAAECRAFAGEERRHGVLCGAVVESFGGEAVAEVPAYPAYPVHADVDAREGALRNVLSICCLSETVAVALIGAERLEMPDGPLRELLTRIYADEVGHCNFGWRLLAEVMPTVDASTKQRLGRYLEVAFGHLERHELAHLPADAAPPAHGVAFGLCSGSDARVLFYEAVTEVIVPGLEAHGLAAARAWAARR